MGWRGQGRKEGIGPTHNNFKIIGQHIAHLSLTIIIYPPPTLLPRFAQSIICFARIYISINSDQQYYNLSNASVSIRSIRSAKLPCRVKCACFLYTVELQWLEHRWLVYHGCFELVLDSLGKNAIAADFG